mmetsp:Transcript_18102/g.35339  ORF Transcript_18102/g.35339 Transcript_18102/m.35339 type:complete len:253 (-) Transcript_18102:210-968(-)
MHGPPKVGNFDLSLAIHQEVLGFDVSVNDILHVAVVKRLSKAPNVEGCSLLIEALEFLELLVELALGGVFEDEVDAALVVEVAVEPKDVLVPQVTLNLNLATKLVLHACFGQLALEQHLERHDVVALLLAREVHVAELAAPEGLPNIKVAELPALRDRPSSTRLLGRGALGGGVARGRGLAGRVGVHPAAGARGGGGEALLGGGGGCAGLERRGGGGVHRGTHGRGGGARCWDLGRHALRPAGADVGLRGIP